MGIIKRQNRSTWEGCTLFRRITRMKHKIEKAISAIDTETAEKATTAVTLGARRDLRLRFLR